MTIITEPPTWNQIVSDRQAHLLQSWAWGQFKGRFDWTPLRLQTEGAAAQILFKQLPLGLTIAYIPKGPLVDWTDQRQCQTLFAQIHTEAKQRRAVFLKVEPDVWHGADKAQAAVQFFEQAGFEAADTIQPPSTIVIDISGDEAAILAAMKQKTRYNIRLARRKGVTVRRGDKAAVELFFRLSQETSNRDEFAIHSQDYYETIYELFAPDRCVLLIADYEGEPLSALMAFCQGQNAYYFYGASSNAHRNLMPTYLIQWEAIRWAKEQGCTRYDLWGIPDADPDTLEAEFTQRSDGLWGVYRFKRGFGGTVTRSVGAFDYVYNPLLYKLYRLRRSG